MTIRNFVLCGVLALACASHASAASYKVFTNPPGSEHITTLADDGVWHAVYSLEVGDASDPLQVNDILIVTSQVQVQNSNATRDILASAQILRDSAPFTVNGSAVTQSNGYNIAPHDYRMVAPKAAVITITSAPTKDYVTLIMKAASGSMDVVNDRGRLEILRIRPNP